jgi:hypothetical protein
LSRAEHELREELGRGTTLRVSKSPRGGWVANIRTAHGHVRVWCANEDADVAVEAAAAAAREVET